MARATLITIVAIWPAVSGASGRAVGFAARDGTQLSALVFDAPSRPAPGVVLVHTLGRSKDEWVPLADRLQAAGFNVLALDLRGHGGSNGNGLHLAAMTGDVRAAVEWLAARPGIRKDSLAIVGASLGANLAALVADELPSLRGLALVSPSLDYQGVRIDPSRWNKLAARTAIWLTASTEDPYALRTVKALADGAGGREQRLSAARGHGTGLFTADSELTPALVDWLRRTLIF